MIFDEATSALDNETEHEINLAIRRLKGKKTILIVAHRLSTVKHCDKLVLLERGQVAGSGSFDELQGNNKTFKELVELARL